MSDNQQAQKNPHAPREMRLEDLTPDMALPHNIFADMGLPNAEMRQAKALVSILFEKTLKGQGLSQRQAAERTGLTQPEVSKIVRGVCSGFTLDRLLSAMAALGQDVEITFQDAPPDQKRGAVRVGPAEADMATGNVLQASSAGGVEIVGIDASNPLRARRKAAASRPQKAQSGASV
jgi:predicted XRE-type DNA-binding protein